MTRTVLLIEDTNEILENIAEILRIKNYEVLTATNGRSGIQLAMDFKPDLILCDLLIPELDGYEVIKHLKKIPETRDIPFICITSQSENESIKRAYNLGANGYIIKPFDFSALIDQVETAMARQR